jgi:hypothetical protein
LARPKFLSRRGPPVGSALFSDHHIGGFDDCDRFVADAKAEVVDSLVGYRGSNDHAVADIDPNMRGRRAFANLDDLALDLIARA